MDKQDKVAYVKSQGQTRNYHCQCKQHWFALPKNLRDLIWQTYEPGQEVDLRPSEAYPDAADKVQQWIAEYVRQQNDQHR